MRYERFIIVLTLSFAASTAAAQPPNTPAGAPDPGTSVAPAQNSVDFGFRATAFGSDSDRARYQRYRDLRNGPFVEGFRFGRDTDTWTFTARADHVGYRDQRYVASYNNYGRLKASFMWDQIPLFFSEDTTTLFTSSTPGVLMIPDDIQSGLQDRTTTPAAIAGRASPFDMRLKRSIADLRLTYTAAKNLDFNFGLKSTQKSGEQPWAGTFGFSNAVELPVPVDTRTTEVGAAAEWTNARGEVRVGYDSSFFRNSVQSLAWDNPLRAGDSPTAGPAQGRMSLWPDSDLNSGSVSGLIKLPATSQATAYVSLGNWSQNQTLIPFTSNTALPQLPLDRPTADTKARVTSTAFALNSRPARHLWLNARFRSYDFDNRTPLFHTASEVVYDTSVAAFDEGATSPYSFTRKTLDLEGSWTPLTFAAFRAGYTRETVDQTFRTFDRTTEHTIRLSADASHVSWLTLRSVYEHGHRIGHGLDEQTLDDIGEHTSLRQFDISNRDLDRFSTIVIVSPASAFSINGSAFVGREDRPETVFGLRSNDNGGASVGFDYVPGETVSVGAAYQYEKYSALQRSRQANPGPQFDDPTRDWTTDSDDHVHTFTASADLLKLAGKTDLRLAYDMSRARSVYVYGLVPNSSLPQPAQLPPVRNTRNRLTADARYPVTKHVVAGVVYWVEKYTVDDFAFDPSTLSTIAQPSFFSLRYLYRPYTANTFWLRATYLF